MSEVLTSGYESADNSLSAALVENYTSAINDAVSSIPTYTLPAATVDSLGGVTLSTVSSVASTVADGLDSTLSENLTSAYISADTSLSAVLVEDYTSMITSVVANLPAAGVTEAICGQALEANL